MGSSGSVKRKGIFRVSLLLPFNVLDILELNSSVWPSAAKASKMPSCLPPLPCRGIYNVSYLHSNLHEAKGFTFYLKVDILTESRARVF